ncbi:hypothetical protein PROFUN_10195 [Planoprotostelium fungivorum]|uniref:Uncharacterized protein n=1 Tax=Planoprotostelium fungivorum TaxID=1890364 RepID=A0A2P6MQ49_9EUKA|nr:hypothetical protein PROFUN_10195 [Planoprotostelium fungivorum]
MWNNGMPVFIQIHQQLIAHFTVELCNRGILAVRLVENASYTSIRVKDQNEECELTATPIMQGWGLLTPLVYPVEEKGHSPFILEVTLRNQIYMGTKIHISNLARIQKPPRHNLIGRISQSPRDECVLYSGNPQTWRRVDFSRSPVHLPYAQFRPLRELNPQMNRQARANHHIL